MAITAFNVGANAGKVLIDNYTSRDIGGTGRNEIYEYTWTATGNCRVFATTFVYEPTGKTYTLLCNGKTVEPKRHVYSECSYSFAVFDANAGDTITVRTDRGRNYQEIYLYAITI